MVSLLLCSSKDQASLNLYNQLIVKEGWLNPIKMYYGTVYKHSKCDVHILLIDNLNHIFADNIDLIHEKEMKTDVKEVLVLSKHVSKSEIPALTIHAIGLPGVTPYGEKGNSGGINGEVVPSSPRFASLFKNLLMIAEEMNLDDSFDITLETTHHGPFLTRPTLYLEIGSTKEEWNRKDLADIWVLTIVKCLGLEGTNALGSWKGEGDVMICLGGGHYAPRHKSIIINSDVWLGHILANYSLLFDGEYKENNDVFSWHHPLEKTIEATKIAFPGGSIFVHLDRKSFKGWQRNAIISYLENRNIPVYRGKQILMLHKNKSSSIIGDES